jgi:hypothetical protein
MTGINIDSLTIVDDAKLEKEQEVKLRAKVADLLPVADKIKEAKKRVEFTLDTEGANGELERLRQAARLQGFSLRILSRVPIKGDEKKTLVTVKAGQLIERTKAETEADEAADIEAEVEAQVVAPKAKPSAKPAK